MINKQKFFYTFSILLILLFFGLLVVVFVQRNTIQRQAFLLRVNTASIDIQNNSCTQNEKVLVKRIKTTQVVYRNIYNCTVSNPVLVGSYSNLTTLKGFINAQN